MGRDERRVAIVDGRVVRAGDAIAGGRIEEVTARGVRYRRGAELRELRLGATAEIKKPAAATAPGRIRIERSTAHEAAVAEER
jgi:hypothetical protein